MGEALGSNAWWGGAVHLCADDFGLNDAVDAGILDLVRLGRLTAVSCMAGGQTIARNLPDLLVAAAAAPHPVQIGLHVTLTEYHALGPIASVAPERQLPTLGGLAALCYRRGVDRAAVAQEIERQMARLTSLLGRRPDFLDGHQHVHLLPGVRDAVALSWQNWTDPPAWIRDCNLPLEDLRWLPSARLKSWILSGMSRAAAPCYASIYAPRNPRFFGVADFSAAQDIAQQMRGWLTLAAKTGGLIMCHPGRAYAPGLKYPPDPIHHHRHRELSYLASPAFLTDLTETGTKPRFGQPLPMP